MTYFVDAWNLFSLVALLSIGPETKNNLNNLRTDFSVSDPPHQLTAKFTMTAKDNKFHASVKYVIFFFKYYAIQSDVRAPS